MRRPAPGAAVVVAPTRNLSYPARYIGPVEVRRKDRRDDFVTMAEVLAQGAAEPSLVFFSQIRLQEV